MAATRARSCVLIRGGDEYLNRRAALDRAHRWLEDHPDGDLIELDAGQCTRYDFEEAVSPSLLAAHAAVILDHADDADEELAAAIGEHCAREGDDPDASLVIVRHSGSNKAKRLVDRLVNAHADVEDVPRLDKPQARLNYTLQCFERHGRRIEPQAAQRLAGVLGETPGELTAMIDQLCFDFPDGPITPAHVDRYLIADPQVTGFAVADQALAGHGAQAVVMLRSAVEQGIEPIALIGALAMKLRSLAKASAVRSGAISQTEANMAPWMVRNATRQLAGWTSPGLARCIRRLAWADEQSKTNGGDPLYALERTIELISRKGIE